MYIRPRKRKTINVWLVVLLLALNGAGLYLLSVLDETEIESPFVPTPTPTRSPFSYVTEADGLYLQGDLAGAIAAYEQAIAISPDDHTLYVPLARLLVIEHRHDEALERAQQAVALDREYAPAWGVLSLAYDWKGWIDDAITAAQRAIELDPTYAEGYAYLAEAYADARRWSEAMATIEIAVSLNPHSVDVHRVYGYVYEIQGYYSRAIDQYRQALDIHPNLAYLHVDVGRNYLALYDTSSAIRAFERAIEIDPNRAETLARLGWTYFAIEEYGAAQRYLEQAIDADPTYGTAYGQLAYTFWMRRNYESAIPNFEMAIELAYQSSRSAARGFFVTVERGQDLRSFPSADVVLQGTFEWAGADRVRRQALLVPETSVGRWADASGRVTLDVTTGETALELTGLPALPPGQVYVGWFDGLLAMNGATVSTGVLFPTDDGAVQTELVANPVRGPRLEHLRDLGRCYYFLARCELAYPLFESALLLSPEDEIVLEAIRMCQESESE